MSDLDKRILEAKEKCLSTVTTRSDGRPYTPNFATADLVQLLLQRAGGGGMTSAEIARELPQRESAPLKLLRRWIEEGKVESRDGRYILSECLPK